MLLVGAGAMAADYAHVLRALGAPALAVGRDPDRAAAFAAEHGIAARGGGVSALDVVPASAIVAVGHLDLAPVATELAERGCRTLLVEKPGALSSAELARAAERVERAGATLYVGYNRRFYPSVSAARDAIAADGGLLSVAFDFTEIEARVLAAGVGADVLARWGLVNSVHVIDLAFHLAGRPASWTSTRRGALPWHPAGAVFAGSGVTEREVPFAYLSTWSGAGRWSVELTTRERKLILRPLEELQEQRRGSFVVETVALDAEELKPGLRAQVEAFLRAAAGEAVDPRLVPSSEAIADLELAEAIFGYAEDEPA